MSLTRIIRALALPLAAWLLAADTASSARADDGGCCGRGGFCPVNIFCRSRKPCIVWKCACANRACNPCTLAEHGYHFPNWRPWPVPVAYHLPANAWATDQLRGPPHGLPTTHPDALPMPRKASDNPVLSR
jgi:hypothetical protein